jgi:hypothetical protein
MPTLRTLPAGARRHPDPLLRFYYERLLDAWSLSERCFARALGPVAGARASASERRLIQGWIDPERFLSMAARRGIHRLINPAAIPLRTNVLKDKARFAAEAQKAGLTAPLTAAAGDEEAIGQIVESCREVVLKPSFSSKGRGVVRLRRGRSGWLASDGSFVSDSAFAERVRDVLRKGGVAQEAVPTHPALEDISPAALPTARVMTFRIGKAQPVAALEVVRLGGGSSPVDNFNCGGLIANVSVRSRLGSSFGKSPDGRLLPVERHPATGKPIARQLPQELGEATRRLAIEAHAAIGTGFAVIGWDIGLTVRGPILVEGNWNPGTILPQCAACRGMSQMPAGALYLKALAAVPPAAWRDARPLQIDW